MSGYDRAMMDSASDTLVLMRRPRRLRRNAAIRELVQETCVTTRDLIQPLFVVAGDAQPEPIASMPGQFRLSIPALVETCRELVSLGIRAVAVFPKLDPELKNATGDEALNPDTLILRAVAAIKHALPELLVITDVALDPYTSHGHDGLLSSDGASVDNDATVDRLAKMAVLNAQAGADFVAPSDMMDGRVAAIRRALDTVGWTQTGILAYSVKYASAYYGPFRDAVGSASAAGTPLLDKATYQMDAANAREACVEARLDELEGADLLMVKPAGPYLDILCRLRGVTQLPLAAYQVSGEYAQIHAAAQLGWLDLERCRDESLLAIKRAGADLILTYFAKDVAKQLNQKDAGTLTSRH